MIAPPADRHFNTLLSGEADALHGWLNRLDSAKMLRNVAVIAVGAGLYGAAMGWRIKGVGH